MSDHDFEVHPRGTYIELSRAGDIALYDPDGNLNCEMDGETVAGVRYVGTQYDSSGLQIVLIERDPIISAHLASDSYPKVPRLAVLGGGVSENNNDVTGGGGQDDA